MKRPLLELAPSASFDWVELGDFPTPVDRVEVRGGELFVKRDDRSSPIYGGNKVRTLETLFGAAKAHGATRIYSTGAFGSNHATATVLHAPRVDLEAGVILFPQPESAAALENLQVILRARPATVCLPHWSFLPFGMAWVRRRDDRAGVRSTLMVPGGATEVGAFGYVSAALELAAQVDAGDLPAPSQLVIGVGSTCTSAGLLLGLRVAADRGLGWRRPPRLVSARVTPWPVTSVYRIVDLAVRTGRELAARTGDRRFAIDGATLRRGLEVDGRYLGTGYGEPTPEGRAAIRTFRERAGFELDTTYSGKAAACALDRVGRGPVLFWSTKSTAPLPEVVPADWRWAPPPMVRWIERARRC
ncbi:MAG: pyridoxal-phosphate dependent enzyme [Myxococcales bacterium]|nr:pyridoxal-phosphate dependent enzyme [Myxococcales bacterium]